MIDHSTTSQVRRGRRPVQPSAAALVTALLLTISAACAQNTFPVLQSFESKARGEALIGQDGWQSADPTGLVAIATTGTFATPPTFTNATHTNSASFSAPTEMPLTGTDGRTQSYIEFMCKPVLGDEPRTINTTNILEWALYFNMQGKLVIQHGDYSWDSPGTGYQPFLTYWTVLDNDPVSSNEWVSVQITVDYKSNNFNTDSYLRLFQVSLNGVPLNSARGWPTPASAHPPPPVPGGSWHFCLDANNPDHDDPDTGSYPLGRMDGHGMQGIGSIDDLFINDSTNVPQFDLTIDSAYPGAEGTPGGTGTYAYEYGATVGCAITNAPVMLGTTTQLVCTGWTNGFGAIAGTGGETGVVAVVEQDSGLKWTWETQYYLDTEAGSGGSVDVPDGWVTANSNVVIEAIPSEGNAFTGWIGDVPPAQTNNNPLTITMNQARTITASFSEAGELYTSRGTPHSWLEQFGVTGDYETADTEDWDDDGAQSWEERVAGTDPTNPVSRFAVLDQRRAGNSIVIDWYGTTNWGVTNGFGMTRSTNLESWDVIVTGGLERAASGTNTWQDDAPPPGAFYRPMIPWQVDP